MTNIINDLKNATKKTESRFDSKEDIYEIDNQNDNRSKNKLKQTFDSTYRDKDRDNYKTEMSEFNINSNPAIKMHKRYESHQNINSLLKKNVDYYTNPIPKSNVNMINLIN